MDDAKRIATQRVHGTVQSGELEHEKGQDVYSFDILGADQQIHEVLVSAKSGKVVSEEIETPGRESAESKVESDSD